MTTATMETPDIITSDDEEITVEDMHTSVNVNPFSELIAMIDKEMERFKSYAFSVFNEIDFAEDTCRFAREGLSKKVTKKVLECLLEDEDNKERTGYYYLLDPYGLICGSAGMKRNGSLQKDDSISLRKITVKSIRNIAKREILEGLKHEFADLLQTRLDFINSLE